MDPGLRRDDASGLGTESYSRPDLCAKETASSCLAALAAMAGFRLGSRAVSGWDSRYESAVLAHRHLDRHLHLAADRPGGSELAARLRCRQPLQPRRLGDRRFSLPGDRARFAPDPVLPAEFRRSRYLADHPDPDLDVPAPADPLRPCPLDHVVRRRLPRQQTAYVSRSA